MPTFFAIKEYIKDCFYHIFNRGVDKRKIFLDNQDYEAFLYFLKKLLTKKIEVRPLSRSDLSSDLSEEIHLLAFALMPNHFHLFIQQLSQRAIIKLMQRLMTSYCMFFNKRHNRTGTLFQERYQATIAYRNEDILNVTNYIHLNPLGFIPSNFTKEDTFKRLVNYPYSSLDYYLREKNDFWVKTEEVLKIAGGRNKYEKLIRDQIINPEALIEDLVSRKLLKV